MEAPPRNSRWSLLTWIFKPRSEQDGPNSEREDHPSQNEASTQGGSKAYTTEHCEALNKLLISLEQDVVCAVKEMKRREHLLGNMQTARVEFETESRVLNREEKALLMYMIREYEQRVRDLERLFAWEERVDGVRYWQARRALQNSMGSGSNRDSPITDGAQYSAGVTKSDCDCWTCVSTEKSVEARIAQMKAKLESARGESAKLWREDFQEESIEILEQLAKYLEELLSQYRSQVEWLEGNLAAERETVQNILREPPGEDESQISRERQAEIRGQEQMRDLPGTDEQQCDSNPATKELREQPRADPCQRQSVGNKIALFRTALAQQTRATGVVQMRLKKLTEDLRMDHSTASSLDARLPLPIPQATSLIPACMASESSLDSIVQSEEPSEQH